MHITTNKILNFIFTPLIKLGEYMGNHYPVTLIKIRYFARFGRFANLKNPKDINEKILYLKLLTDTSMWTKLSDKYEVRDYVKECGLGQYLVKLYGMWTDVNDIDFDSLPSSFIFKANNGDGKGSNLIVNNKDDWDKEKLKKILDKWLKRKNVGALAAEPQYENIRPCIIAEELLPLEESSKSLIDYKIWCFNGKPYYIWTCSDRDNKGTDVMTYDLDWNAHPEYSIFDSRYRKGKVMDKPKNLEYMLEVAEKLSKPFPEVRVDLYNIDGKIYFGELTFTSLGGMMNFYTPEFLKEMGDKVDINYKG